MQMLVQRDAREAGQVDRVDEKFDRIDERFDRVDERLVEVDRRITETAKATDLRLKEVDRRITEGKEDSSRRYKEVNRRLDETNNRITEAAAGLKGEIRETKEAIKGLGQQMHSVQITYMRGHFALVAS